MMELIIGPPREGKSSLCAARGLERMRGEYARRAIKLAQSEAAMLNANGFNVSLPPSMKHSVYTYKFEINAKSPDFGHRKSFEAHPENFGFEAEGFEPWFPPCGSTLILDEFQSVYDSRNWNQFPENVARAYEQHGKKMLDIWIISQHPNLVELRVRQLCSITLVVGMEELYNKWGEICTTNWKLLHWDRYEDWEKGKVPWGELYTYNGNVRKIYNTYAGVEMFYAGLQKKNFGVDEHCPVDLTPEGIAKYVKEHNIQFKKKKENAA